MTTSEFPLIVTLADAAHGRTIAVEADADAREAIARRLGLVALDRFSLAAEVRVVAGGIAAKGEVRADVVQACAATDLPVPATLAEAFDLRFLRDMDAPASEDDEIEIGSEDLDLLPLDGDRIDLGEAAEQTLALALDPYLDRLEAEGAG